MHETEGVLAFNPQKRAECITMYPQTWSIIQMHRNYRPTCAENPPARNYILRWAQNFQNNSRVGNAQESRKSAASSGNEQWVPNYSIRYPSSSLRGTEQDLVIARGSFRDILWNGLHVFLYKLHNVQQLEDHDHTARIEFSNWCLQSIQWDASFLNHMNYSDEFVFHVDGKSTSTMSELGTRKTLISKEKYPEIGKN